MINRWAVASYEQIPAMEISPEGEWVKWEDYDDLKEAYEHVVEHRNLLAEQHEVLLAKYDTLSTSEGFLNEELQEWKKKYYTLMEGYNLLENRVQTLSYKAYPARNGSGE
jgi:predicted nuclease with TOPRIM domain